MLGRAPRDWGAGQVLFVGAPWSGLLERPWFGDPFLLLQPKSKIAAEHAESDDFRFARLSFLIWLTRCGPFFQGFLRKAFPSVSLLSIPGREVARNLEGDVR